MGAKSRGNWRMGMCLKSDCKNRGRCDECFRFSLYEGVNEDGRQDSEGSGVDLREDVSR